MGVSLGVVNWRRENGHEAIHLRDEGLQSATDEVVFEMAASELRVLLTFDLDFGEIIALSTEQPPSVILFRLRNPRTSHVIERLRDAVEQTTPALEQGAIVVAEETRLRVRRLPLGT
jgi:predicted nuclease of predicted toxin-antitoxin system